MTHDPDTDEPVEGAWIHAIDDDEGDPVLAYPSFEAAEAGAAAHERKWGFRCVPRRLIEATGSPVENPTTPPLEATAV